jgi:hypothetical protein
VAKAVRDTWAKLVRELKKEKESANAVSDTAEASP